MDRYEARKADRRRTWRRAAIWSSIEDHSAQRRHLLPLPHRRWSRCVSKQWFVKMAPLAKPAIDVVRGRARCRFIPERMDKDVLQLDGEHQRLVHFPSAVVGAPDSGVVLRRTAARLIVAARDARRLPEVRQRPAASGRGCAGHLVLVGAVAVLHARLAGRDRRICDYFYPTDTLVTGYDIIFFWVARMIFSGLEHMGRGAV